MYLWAYDIVEHPDVTYPQPELGTRQPSQAFDPRLARLRRPVSQVALDRILDLSPDIGLQMAEVLDGLRREDNLIAHSGYIIATIIGTSRDNREDQWVSADALPGIATDRHMMEGAGLGEAEGAGHTGECIPL